MPRIHLNLCLMIRNTVHFVSGSVGCRPMRRRSGCNNLPFAVQNFDTCCCPHQSMFVIEHTDNEEHDQGSCEEHSLGRRKVCCQFLDGKGSFFAAGSFPVEPKTKGSRITLPANDPLRKRPILGMKCTILTPCVDS